ncbi:hypothetical protein KCU95_g13743, partial [Aureobasidium melanogenum]
METAPTTSLLAFFTILLSSLQHINADMPNLQAYHKFILYDYGQISVRVFQRVQHLRRLRNGEISDERLEHQLVQSLWMLKVLENIWTNRANQFASGFICGLSWSS